MPSTSAHSLLTERLKRQRKSSSLLVIADNCYQSRYFLITNHPLIRNPSWAATHFNNLLMAFSRSVAFVVAIATLRISTPDVDE